jgi:hypothetical protein
MASLRDIVMWPFRRETPAKTRTLRVYLVCHGDDEYHTARVFKSEWDAEQGAADVVAASLTPSDRSTINRENWRSRLEEINSTYRLVGRPPHLAKSGKSLERLVAALEELVATDGRLSIETSAKLREHVSGIEREIDVLTTYRTGNHTTRIAFECKDYSRPVGVERVESFATKIGDLPIDKGVMVSRSGFTRPAILKAAQKKIVLQSIERATSMDWLGIAGVLEDSIAIKSVAVEVKRKRMWRPAAAIFDKDGIEISTARLVDAIAVPLLCRPNEWERSTARSDTKLNSTELVIHGISKAITPDGKEMRPMSPAYMWAFSSREDSARLGILNTSAWPTATRGCVSLKQHCAKAARVSCLLCWSGALLKGPISPLS